MFCVVHLTINIILLKKYCKFIKKKQPYIGPKVFQSTHTIFTTYAKTLGEAQNGIQSLIATSILIKLICSIRYDICLIFPPQGTPHTSGTTPVVHLQYGPFVAVRYNSFSKKDFIFLRCNRQDSSLILN